MILTTQIGSGRDFPGFPPTFLEYAISRQAAQVDSKPIPKEIKIVRTGRR